MKKLLAFAVAMLVVSPAFAAVQNVKVSGDIDNWYVGRSNFALGARDASTQHKGLTRQSVFIEQTRLRVDADLSDNVSATVRLLNENTWGNANNAGGVGNVNVDLAYATLREFLYSPLTVTVGRQEFIYGNGLILGGNGPNNDTQGGLKGVAKDLTKNASNDGVKLVLDYKPLVLDLIYFKSNQTDFTGNLNSSKTSSDVFGANANYNLGDSMNTMVEGYFFARVNGSSTVSNSNQNDTVYVPGLRVSTNPIKGLNTQAEFAWQGGNKSITGSAAGGDNVRRNAIAYQLMASYAIDYEKTAKYKPTLNASFSHFSGDKNANVARSTGGNPASRENYLAWDPMLEGQNGGTIFSAIYGLSNLNIWNVGGSITPIEDVTTSFNWYNLSADRKYSGVNPLTINQPDNQTAITAATTGRKDLGNEYDVNVDYAYTEDVKMGVSLGWYVPGKALTSANDTVASQALAHVAVAF